MRSKSGLIYCPKGKSPGVQARIVIRTLAFRPLITLMYPSASQSAENAAAIPRKSPLALLERISKPQHRRRNVVLDPSAPWRCGTND